MAEDAVQAKVYALIQRYGADIVSEPKRLEALLSDYLPNNRRERKILITSLNEQVPAELLSSAMPAQLLHARLIARLRDDCGLSEEAAQWAVATWTLALGIRLEVNSNAEKPQPVPLTPEPSVATSIKPPVQGKTINVMLTLTATEASKGGPRTVPVEGRNERITLPAGLTGTQVLSFANQGGLGENGGRNGALIVQVTVLPELEPIRGNDMVSTLSLMWAEAQVGCEKTISMRGKDVKITVPANIQNNQQLVFAGQGEPGQNGGASGNFILKVTVAPRLSEPPPPIPPSISAIEKLKSQYGIEMVLIPGGPFRMGDDDQSDNPPHTVTLSPYYIAKNVVTVKQYLEFCTATGHTKPAAPSFNPTWSKEDHPIVNVSWEDAKAYCDWLSKQTGLAVTLPTEAQWEKAARGTDGRKFPWGNTFDRSKLQCSKKDWGDAGGTCAVGLYSDSPYGLSDMAGNVWQWCSDWYDKDYWKSDHGADPTGPTFPTEAIPEKKRGSMFSRILGLETDSTSSQKRRRALRGGSWSFYYEANFRCALRVIIAPGSRSGDLGFRCVARADTH